jgi:hypothetical protein
MNAQDEPVWWISSCRRTCITKEPKQRWLSAVMYCWKNRCACSSDNGGRIVAASALVLSGWLKSLPGMDLRLAITLLGLLFPLGLVIIFFLPETKDRPLPE